MKNQVHPYWRIAAIILGIVAIGKIMELSQVHSTLDDIFLYEVTVTVVDKKTKEIITGVTTHHPTVSSADLFQQISNSTGGREFIRISGIGYEPREFGFSAEGYERKNIVVTDDTPPTATVELEPKN